MENPSLQDFQKTGMNVLRLTSKNQPDMFAISTGGQGSAWRQVHPNDLSSLGIDPNSVQSQTRDAPGMVGPQTPYFNQSIVGALNPQQILSQYQSNLQYQNALNTPASTTTPQNVPPGYQTTSAGAVVNPNLPIGGGSPLPGTPFTGSGSGGATGFASSTPQTSSYQAASAGQSTLPSWAQHLSASDLANPAVQASLQQAGITPAQVQAGQAVQQQNAAVPPTGNVPPATTGISPAGTTVPTQQTQGQPIKRNLAAEQQFVQSWQGKEGRLPTSAEINQAVYGTPNPNFSTPQGVSPTGATPSSSTSGAAGTPAQTSDQSGQPQNISSLLSQQKTLQDKIAQEETALQNKYGQFVASGNAPLSVLQGEAGIALQQAQSQIQQDQQDLANLQGQISQTAQLEQPIGMPFGQSVYQYNPQTGQYEQTQQGMKVTSDIAGYQLAQQQGFQGNFLDYIQQKSLVTAGGKDTLSMQKTYPYAGILSTDTPDQAAQKVANYAYAKYQFGLEPTAGTYTTPTGEQGFYQKKAPINVPGQAPANVPPSVNPAPQRPASSPAATAASMGSPVKPAPRQATRSQASPPYKIPAGLANTVKKASSNIVTPPSAPSSMQDRIDKETSLLDKQIANNDTVGAGKTQSLINSMISQQKGYVSIANSLIGKQLSSDKTVQSYVSAAPMLARAKASYNSKQTAAGDQDLVDAVTQMDSGGYKISRGQLALFENARSLQSKFAAGALKLNPDGGFLSQTDRTNLINLANANFKLMQDAYQQHIADYQNTLKGAGIPQADFPITDVSIPAIIKGLPGGTATTASGINW